MGGEYQEATQTLRGGSPRDFIGRSIYETTATRQDGMCAVVPVSNRVKNPRIYLPQFTGL